MTPEQQAEYDGHGAPGWTSRLQAAGHRPAAASKFPAIAIDYDATIAGCRRAYDSKRLLAQQPAATHYGYRLSIIDKNGDAIECRCPIGAGMTDEQVAQVDELGLQEDTLDGPRGRLWFVVASSSGFGSDVGNRMRLRKLQEYHDTWQSSKLHPVNENTMFNLPERAFTTYLETLEQELRRHRLMNRPLPVPVSMVGAKLKGWAARASTLLFGE